MATIKNAITMQDRMSPVLNKMAKAMQSNLAIMEKLNKTSNTGITGKAFSRAQKDINAATNSLKQFQNNLRKSKQETDGLSSSMRGLGNSSSGLGLLNANAAIGLARQTGEIASGATRYLDTMSLSKARIDQINDGTQTTSELQDKILFSADRARMSYKAMLDSVAKLNLLAKDQFSGNNEAIAFVETLNKMFIISGASAEEATSATYQLNQAMAAGKLQGDEFRSIMENAPMLADAIAKEMGKTKGELKELSSEGLITAGIIKNAMFNYADEVEEKFSKMPMTFGQKMQQVSNKLMKNLEPVSNKFSELLNSDQGARFFNALIDGTVLLAEVAVKTLDIVSKGIMWVQDNIQYLLPFITAIGIAMVSAAIASGAAWTIAHLPLLIIIGTLGSIIGIAFELGATFSDVFNFISSSLQYLIPIFAMVAIVYLALWIEQLWAIIPPLIAQALAWAAVNWPILLVAAAIGIVIFILGQLGVTFGQVVGFVVGTLYALLSVVCNVITLIANPFIILATFIGNLFIDPIAAVKMLFLDMAAYIVDQVAWVAKSLEDLINLIPGVEVNISSGINDIAEMIKAAREKVEIESGVKQADLLKPVDVGEQALKGYNNGSNFINNFGNGLGGIKDLFDMDKYKQPSISVPNASSFAKPDEISKVGEVGKIKGDVSITDEDIKLLKDIAATKFINSYTTLKPEMKVEFTGDIKETADVNKILEVIEDMTEEALANVIVEEAV